MTTALTLDSFPLGFRALVIGASGGIGQAFVQALRAHPRCAEVVGLHRRSQPRLDMDDEASIGQAADALRAGGTFHLIIHAAGVLHGPGFMPEKKLGDLNYAQLEATLRANTLGPALVLRHFVPLLDRQRGVLALLSERVHDLFMEPVAPQKGQMPGAKRSRAGGPASICNAADAPFVGQPFGQGSKKPHSALRALSRPPAWTAARASIAAFCCLAGTMKRP